jgi:hypothetical protein
VKFGLRAALLLALLALPGTVRADDSGPGPFSQLHYGIMGGGMIPAGPQGRELRRGWNLAAEVYNETGFGIQFGGEVSLTTSTDTLSTRITQFGIFARLSPSPEDYRLYVQFGLAGYAVSYDPSPPTVTHPASLVRPGGSFAVGAEVAHFSNFSVGGSVAYVGILLQLHHALAFALIRLHLTYRRFSL